MKIDKWGAFEFWFIGFLCGITTLVLLSVICN